MFKKIVVGALVTGTVLSGTGGVFAAETSTINNHTNSAIEKSIKSVKSKASVDISVRSNGEVRFYAEDLENEFTNEYYDEIVFTIEDHGSKDYLKKLDWDQEIISVTPDKNEFSRTTNRAKITFGDKSILLDKLYKIYNDMGYEMPNDTITVYAYAKPANDNKYWPLQAFELNVKDLY